MRSNSSTSRPRLALQLGDGGGSDGLCLRLIHRHIYEVQQPPDNFVELVCDQFGTPGLSRGPFLDGGFTID